MSVAPQARLGLTARAALGFALASALAGCSGADDTPAEPQASSEVVVTTSPATKEIDQVTWGTYRQIGSLDPIVAFDFPENTIISSMCEAALRQDPSGAVVPGLTELSRPDDTTYVLSVVDGATFWDGSPVTAEDVAFSLSRAADPKAGGYYADVFSRVSSIEVTGNSEVTMKLNEPDAWLEGEIASTPGVVLSKTFTEAQGEAYGTIEGGTMCTGAFKLKSWTSSSIIVERNDDYWNPDVRPKVGEIEFLPVPDRTTLVSGLLSGEIDGTYASGPLPNLDQIRDSDTVDLVRGPGAQSDLLVVSDLSGPLGDVKVRQALSQALDREGIISSVYAGTAVLPRWLSNEGTFGYAKDTFEAAFSQAPEMKQDLDAAKATADGLDLEGQSITIATSPDSPGFTAAASAYQAAGKEIGLDVELKALSAQQYGSLFVDASTREGVDAFLTVNYGDFADPAALLQTIVLPGAFQNFSGFDDKELNELFEQARGTSDETDRADLMIKVSELASDLLPWIPNVQPSNLLVLNSKLTGAVASFSYMFAPWANELGGK